MTPGWRRFCQGMLCFAVIMAVWSAVFGLWLTTVAMVCSAVTGGVTLYKTRNEDQRR